MWVVRVALSAWRTAALSLVVDANTVCIRCTLLIHTDGDTLPQASGVRTANEVFSAV